MKKVCVTMIFGDYDDLKEPTVVNEDWKYICISDRHHKSKVWKTKIFKDDKLTNKLKTGYVITQLHKLVDYDIACLVGGQIQINTDLNKYIDFDCDFKTMNHPTRDCVYDEAFACIMLDKDDPKRIAQTMTKYSKAGLPKNAGMIQTGVTFRRNTKEFNRFLESWWFAIISGSHRDQLSFNFVNWVLPIKYETMDSKLMRKEFKIHQHK